MKIIILKVLLVVDEYIAHSVWELISGHDNFDPKPWDKAFTNFCIWVHEEYHKAVEAEVARIHR